MWDRWRAALRAARDVSLRSLLVYLRFVVTDVTAGYIHSHSPKMTRTAVRERSSNRNSHPCQWRKKETTVSNSGGTRVAKKKKNYNPVSFNPGFNGHLYHSQHSSLCSHMLGTVMRLFHLAEGSINKGDLSPLFIRRSSNFEHRGINISSSKPQMTSCGP